MSDGEVEALLEPMLKRRLMVRENNSYLSLAIPLGRYSPSTSVIKRFYEVACSLGESSENEVIDHTSCGNPIARVFLSIESFRYAMTQ